VISTCGDFLPACPLSVLELRARLLKVVRDFFSERGYLEVETPVLSHDVSVDAHLEPFVTQWMPEDASDTGSETLYLQTSPEFAMKRLLAAGAKAIYQVARAFRNGESGRLHNPEFTIVEWYRVGATYHQQMDEVEALIRRILGNKWGGFPRLSYREAFLRHIGLDPFASDMAALRTAITVRGLSHAWQASADEDKDTLLNLLLAELVEPRLGQESPEFLYDYPVSQAALARTRPDNPEVAERFELYIRGVEICNGYGELTDARELRERVCRQNTLRVKARRRALPESSRLLAAMEAGLPACSGVALGFDRLVMIAAGASSLREVMPFPHELA